MVDHQKASDVHRDADYMFSRKVSFAEAFPTVATYDVKVVEGDYGNERPAYWSGGEYADCRNPVCYNGGVSIGNIIRSMVAAGQTELTTSELCQGYEGSPKGQRRYRDCMHHFEVSIALTYKATETPST